MVERKVHTPSELRIREEEGGAPSRTITGYAILFNTPSVPLWETDEEEAREVIAPEAVTRDFLDGCDKIEPAYQQQAMAEFCAVIAAYFNKHNRG